MADSALQTPAQEPIHKLIVFIFWAHLIRVPCSGSAKLWRSHLCDPTVPLKLKDKFYRTVIWLIMLYRAEYWPTKMRHVQQLSVAEMCMLWWICGHIRRDRVQNDEIRERLGVTPVEEKLMQHCLRWFWYIQQRPVEATIHNGIIRWTDNENRGRGWPNLTCGESVKRYLKDWCITKEITLDRRE
jgi:hypothetical protein